MQNQSIRSAAACSGVKLWEVAHVLGVTDSTFSRKLRVELSREDQEKILAIIERIRKEHICDAAHHSKSS